MGSGTGPSTRTPETGKGTYDVHKQRAALGSYESRRRQFEAMRGNTGAPDTLWGAKDAQDRYRILRQYNPAPDYTDAMLRAILQASSPATGTTRASTFRTLLT